MTLYFISDEYALGLFVFFNGAALVSTHRHQKNQTTTRFISPHPSTCGYNAELVRSLKQYNMPILNLACTSGLRQGTGWLLTRESDQITRLVGQTRRPAN